MEGVILFIVIAIAVIAFGRARAKAVAEAWGRAARELDLALTPGGAFSRPTIAGRSGPFEVKIDTRKSNDKVFTRYRVDYPSTAPDFKLTRQHALSAITKLFGAQDIEVGDEAFDDAFVVKSDDPEMLSAWLTPSRRVSLLRLRTLGQNLEITDGSVRLTMGGMERQPERIVSIARRLIGAARELSSEPSHAADEAVLVQRRGELAEAAQLLDRAIEERGEDDIEARLTGVEVFASAGDTERATAVLDDLERHLPADPEVRGWRETLARPPATTTGQDAPAPPASAEAPPDMLERLFSVDRLSFDTIRLFNEEYAGMRVHWSGTVKSARSFDRDLDFGKGPGTKAVVSVARIENDLYGNTQIDAVLALPADMADRLPRGREISFSGTLAKVDPLMRNIFVTDAVLD